MDKETTLSIIDKLMFVFNEKQLIEERALKNSPFSDLSVKEMQTIIVIGSGENFNHSQVATKLGVTSGTLSVSVKNLVNKGYVLRERDDKDRRYIHLKLTKNGRLVYRLNRRFYRNMVYRILTDIDQEYVDVLIKALDAIHDFMDDTEMTLDD